MGATQRGVQADSGYGSQIVNNDDQVRRLLKIVKSRKKLRGVSIISIGQDPDRDQRIKEGWQSKQESFYPL